jgi:uncharacterized coiled-coil protein SlyX
MVDCVQFIVGMLNAAMQGRPKIVHVAGMRRAPPAPACDGGQLGRSTFARSAPAQRARAGRLGRVPGALLLSHRGTVLLSNQPEEGGEQMNSVLSSTRSWFSAGHWRTQPSDDATLVPGDPNLSVAPKNDGRLSKLLDRRISVAIAFLITFCIGVAAALVWQSFGQVSVPQAAPAPAALSPTVEQQLEAVSSGLAAVQQSIDELSSGLGQMRRDIANLQTSEQALLDKISEPPQRPAAAPSPKSTPRPSQAPTPAR